MNALAHLGWVRVRPPHPVFEGDTIYSQSEVLVAHVGLPVERRGRRGTHRRVQPGRSRCNHFPTDDADLQARPWVKSGPYGAKLGQEFSSRRTHRKFRRTGVKEGEVPAADLATRSAVELRRIGLYSSLAPKGR